MLFKNKGVENFMVVGKILGVIILAVIVTNVMIAVLPVTFNSTATTSFTVWGVDYLWVIGLFALILVFGSVLAFWNEIKTAINM